MVKKILCLYNAQVNLVSLTSVAQYKRPAYKILPDDYQGLCVDYNKGITPVLCSIRLFISSFWEKKDLFGPQFGPREKTATRRPKYVE